MSEQNIFFFNKNEENGTTKIIKIAFQRFPKDPIKNEIFFQTLININGIHFKKIPQQLCPRRICMKLKWTERVANNLSLKFLISKISH